MITTDELHETLDMLTDARATGSPLIDLIQVALELLAEGREGDDPHVRETLCVRAKIAVAKIAAMPDDRWEKPELRDWMVAKMREMLREKAGWTV